MTLKVKTKVTLEFLGDEYKNSYINLYSVPMSEYEAMIKRIETLQDASSTEALLFVRDAVSERFVDGEIAQDGKLVPITAENLPDLPGEVFTEALGRITGRSSPNF